MRDLLVVLKKLLTRYILTKGWISLTSSIIVAMATNSLEAYRDMMYTMSEIMSSSSSSIISSNGMVVVAGT